MKELIEKFPAQLLEALQIGKLAKLSLPAKNYSEVVVSGLGGSGIGASIIQDYVNDQLPIPFIVNKTYTIPKHVGENTLFIACSYSGNTEETLAALHMAKTRKAQLVCVSSGGELIRLATKWKIPYIQIPAGNPPRASLAYSIVQLLYILRAVKLIKSSPEKLISPAVQLITKQSKQIEESAQNLAKTIAGKQLAIYTNVGYEGLAIRFRQQINENSKQLGWHNVVPEMTHNEIVGWTSNNPNVFVLYCYHKKDYAKYLTRMNYLKKVLKSYKAQSADLIMKGETYWERAVYFIHLTDFISLHLAQINQQDAMQVKVIDGLKNTMAKHSS